MRTHWDRAARAAGAAALLLGLACAAAPLWAGGGGQGVKEGDPAPDVNLPATQAETAVPDQKGAKTLRLSDLKGKKNVVLWFYPKALTGG